MHYKKSKLNRFVILSCLLFFILIITVNYAMGFYYFNFIKRPFDVSSHGVVLKQEQAQNQSYLDLVGLDEKNVRLILKRDDSKVIGLYDPEHIYYQKAFKVTDTQNLRYFSNSDYQNANDVAVAVSQCELSNYTQIKTLSKQFNTTVINCFEDSPLAYEHTILAKNLFTFQVEQGDMLFIDSENRDQVDDLKNNLEQQGFVEIEDVDKNFDMMAAVSFAYQGKYQRFLIIAAFFSILLYIIICYTVITKNKKKMQISIISGANFWTMLVKLNGSDWIKSIILCALASSYVWLLQALNYQYLTITNLTKLYVYYIAYMTITYLVFYTMAYHQVKRRLR